MAFDIKFNFTEDLSFTVERFTDEEEAPKRKEYTLYAPKSREMNDNPDDDFVAIDFETMTRVPTSACALGMVRVIDGQIAQRFYSLINPVRDDFTEKEPNFRIHGIALAEAEKAPDFKEVFEFMRRFVGPYKLVCHNRNADIRILEALMEYFDLDGLDTTNNECTYELTGKSLSMCCSELNIKLPSHHDALCDAEACAKIYLNHIGQPLINQSTGSLSDIYKSKGAKKIDKENRVRLDDELISDKNTPFYDSAVVITGVFENLPDRNELAHKLQALGARIVSSISKKTNIVVVGEGAGPKKIEKINELKAEGCDIRIIYEPELYSILSI